VHRILQHRMFFTLTRSTHEREKGNSKVPRIQNGALALGSQQINKKRSCTSQERSRIFSSECSLKSTCSSRLTFLQLVATGTDALELRGAMHMSCARNFSTGPSLGYVASEAHETINLLHEEHGNCRVHPLLQLPTIRHWCPRVA